MSENKTRYEQFKDRYLAKSDEGDKYRGAILKKWGEAFGDGFPYGIEDYDRDKYAFNSQIESGIKESFRTNPTQESSLPKSAFPKKCTGKLVWTGGSYHNAKEAGGHCCARWKGGYMGSKITNPREKKYNHGCGYAFTKGPKVMKESDFPSNEEVEAEETKEEEALLPGITNNLEKLPYWYEMVKHFPENKRDEDINTRRKNWYDGERDELKGRDKNLELFFDDNNVISSSSFFNTLDLQGKINHLDSLMDHFNAYYYIKCKNNFFKKKNLGSKGNMSIPCRFIIDNLNQVLWEIEEDNKKTAKIQGKDTQLYKRTEINDRKQKFNEILNELYIKIHEFIKTFPDMINDEADITDEAIWNKWGGYDPTYKDYLQGQDDDGQIFPLSDLKGNEKIKKTENEDLNLIKKILPKKIKKKFCQQCLKWWSNKDEDTGGEYFNIKLKDYQGVLYVNQFGPWNIIKYD